jgi:hypothetical protein
MGMVGISLTKISFTLVIRAAVMASYDFCGVLDRIIITYRMDK